MGPPHDGRCGPPNQFVVTWDLPRRPAGGSWIFGILEPTLGRAGPSSWRPFCLALRRPKWPKSALLLMLWMDIAEVAVGPHPTLS